MALVLRVGEVTAELSTGIDRIVSDEKASSYRKPGVTHNVGIAQETGIAIPVREFNFAFSAVNDRFAKCDRKADRGIEDLVVVGKIIHVAAEVVCVKAKPAEKTLGGPEFEVVSARGFHWEAEDVRV